MSLISQKGASKFSMHRSQTYYVQFIRLLMLQWVIFVCRCVCVILVLHYSFLYRNQIAFYILTALLLKTDSSIDSALCGDFLEYLCSHLGERLLLIWTVLFLPFQSLLTTFCFQMYWSGIIV